MVPSSPSSRATVCTDVLFEIQFDFLEIPDHRLRVHHLLNQLLIPPRAKVRSRKRARPGALHKDVRNV